MIIMLLPIFLFPILSVNALLHFPNILNKTSFIKLDPSDMIPKIENFTRVLQDTPFSSMKLITKYNYTGETHKTTTSDGYILELHRITGRDNSNDSQLEKPVVLLMAGILCSSTCWLIAGNQRSLAFILADAGYDVWLGNYRGTMYSLGHVVYSSDKNNKDYWNFSFHEIGTQDLPAIIDYIVKVTGRKKMFYVGHSQGTTTFFVMASERPEYQSKIKAMFAMSPIAFCSRMKSPLLKILSSFTIPIQLTTELIGFYKFELSDILTRKVQQEVCMEDAITQPLCWNLIFLLSGFNYQQADMKLLPVLLEYYPDSASTKQLIHYGQLINSGLYSSRGKFQQFDYGMVRNMKIYGQPEPPSYNLTKIQVPVALHYSSNDWLLNVTDLEETYNELGNPLGKFLVPDPRFNHIDFFWAKDVKTLVYDRILDQINQFL